MNDADFEMLARQSGGAFDAWLRSQALGHAIRWRGARPLDTTLLMTDANRFYDYLKGESSANLHRQDER
jgi:hypothetical protein